MQKKISLSSLWLCGACGTTISPHDVSLPTVDGSARSDGATEDTAVVPAALQQPPTSLIRVTKVSASSDRAGGTQVAAWLFPLASEGADVEDREIGECFFRRASYDQQRYIDGVATWAVGTARGQLRPFSERGPLVFDDIVPTPTHGAVVEISLTGSAFPSFVVRAAMPLPLVVTQPTDAQASVPMPRDGQSLSVRWNVPAIPASAIVRVSWEMGVKNIYCVVPATRGEYSMPGEVVSLFRSATDAVLVVSHATVLVTSAGNRPLRYIVEHRSITHAITP